MKKRILSLLLCVAMLLSMVPFAIAAEAPEVATDDLATATEVHGSEAERALEMVDAAAFAEIEQNQERTVLYPFIILELGDREVQVEVDREDGFIPELPAGVSYTPETHTLTLNNVSLSRLELSGLADIPVTVQVLGSNTIFVNCDNIEEHHDNPLEIRGCNNVTFTGGGTLNVVSGYSGEPYIYTEGIYVHDTFLAEDVYSYRNDTAIVTGERNSTLCFDGVKINIENQLQRSEVDCSDEYAHFFFGSGGDPAELIFGQVDLRNNADITISGQSNAVIRGNVTIDNTSSLTANGIDFRNYDNGIDPNLPDSNCTVTVKGTLKSTGISDDIIQKSWALVRQAYPDLTILMFADGGIFVGSNVTLIQDGGNISSVSSAYSPSGLTVYGNYELRRGSLSVYVKDFNKPENDTFNYGNVDGIRISNGSFVQSGGNISINGADLDASDIELQGVVVSNEANVELNGGTINIDLPKSAMVAECIWACASTVNCNGTVITASSKDNSTVETIYGITILQDSMPDSQPARFQFNSGSFTLSPSGKVTDITFLAVSNLSRDGKEGATMQITGGDITVDLSNCTYRSARGVRVSDYSSFYVAGGNISMKLNGSSRDTGLILNTGFTLYDNANAQFSGGTVDISVATESASNGFEVRESSSLVINGTANLKLGTAETGLENGIVCLNSELTIDGTPTIDIESAGAGISLTSGSVGKIAGGTVRINQKYQGSSLESVIREGIAVEGSTLSFLGGETYLRGGHPLTYLHAESQTPVTYADGIHANILGLDGTPVRAASVEEQPFEAGVNGCYVDPEIVSGAEFNVLICQQDPVPPKYNGTLELVNTGAITAGLSYHARFQATLPAEDGDVTFTLSDGMQVVNRSVTINSVPATSSQYSISGNTLTVHMNSGDVVRFDVIPAPGVNSITSSTEQGDSETVTFEAAAYTFSAPTDTNQPEVQLTGTALAEARVDIYVNGTLAGTTTASKAGNWAVPVTVQEGDNEV